MKIIDNKHTLLYIRPTQYNDMRACVNCPNASTGLSPVPIYATIDIISFIMNKLSVSRFITPFDFKYTHSFLSTYPQI